MTAIGIFLIVVGWFMAIGNGVIANSPLYSTLQRASGMLTSAGLVASGVYILAV